VDQAKVLPSRQGQHSASRKSVKIVLQQHIAGHSSS
jgi:hypothetical protein